VTTIQVIETRDEAVRILYRAISFAQQYEYRSALRELDSERAREWYEDVQSLSGLGCIFTKREGGA
jgi:hypothetical protein